MDRGQRAAALHERMRPLHHGDALRHRRIKHRQRRSYLERAPGECPRAIDKNTQLRSCESAHDRIKPECSTTDRATACHVTQYSAEIHGIGLTQIPPVNYRSRLEGRRGRINHRGRGFLGGGCEAERDLRGLPNRHGHRQASRPVADRAHLHGIRLRWQPIDPEGALGIRGRAVQRARHHHIDVRQRRLRLPIDHLSGDSPRVLRGRRREPACPCDETYQDDNETRRRSQRSIGHEWKSGRYREHIGGGNVLKRPTALQFHRVSSTASVSENLASGSPIDRG